MARVERRIDEEGGDVQFLTSDVLREVFGRVDAETLARASCVSAQFRSVCYEEAFWERLCNNRWASTKEAPVKALVAAVGGFRRFYSDCFPFVLCNREGCARQVEDDTPASSSSDFVSIVDVTYNGEAVFSKMVDGIPGAEAPCGPLVDIFEAATLEGHGVSIQKEEDEGAVVTVHTNIPRVSSVAQERRDGKFWAALCNQVRVSWILINTKTHRMVNIGSWKPLGGMRHRPCGDDFLLRFGSILPTASSPIHCNITLRCRTCTAPAPEFPEHQAESTPATTVVKMTELGMLLEDAHSVHLRGQEAIRLLSRIMTCDRTVAESKVSSNYLAFVEIQSSNRESLIRRESQRQIAGAAFYVGIIVLAIFFLI